MGLSGSAGDVAESPAEAGDAFEAYCSLWVRSKRGLNYSHKSGEMLTGRLAKSKEMDGGDTC